MVDAYLDGPTQLRQAIAGMSHEHLLARPIPGRWSTLEVICHLTDSEQAWCHRLKRVIAEERPLIVGYDESRFTAALHYESSDPAVELDLLESMRRQMARILRRIPEGAWSRVGVHNERGLVSLEEMVVIETEHVTHHLNHVIEKRRALGLLEPA